MVLLAFLFLGLVIAAYSDVRTREVPDTVSYGLITLGLLGGLIRAIVTDSPAVFGQHALGFLIGLLLGLGMYYGRQWGGGDAKLMMGVGAVLGFSLSDTSLLSFLILLVLAGAVYGFLYTTGLAISKRKTFVPAFRKMIRRPTVHRARIGLVVSAALLLVLLFLLPRARLLIGVVLIGMYLLTYSWIFIKTVEESIMIKRYPVGKLTEGDWLAEDIVRQGRTLAKAKGIGLTKEQIAKLKKSKVRTVKVREGIPFVPNFLIAFVLLLILDQYGLDLLSWLV